MSGSEIIYFLIAFYFRLIRRMCQENHSKINRLQRWRLSGIVTQALISHEIVSFEITVNTRHVRSGRGRQDGGRGDVTEGSRQKHDASCLEGRKKLDSPCVPHVPYPSQACARRTGAAGVLKGQRGSFGRQPTLAPLHEA